MDTVTDNKKCVGFVNWLVLFVKSTFWSCLGWLMLLRISELARWDYPVLLLWIPLVIFLVFCALYIVKQGYITPLKKEWIRPPLWVQFALTYTTIAGLSVWHFGLSRTYPRALLVPPAIFILTAWVKRPHKSAPSENKEPSPEERIKTLSDLKIWAQSDAPISVRGDDEFGRGPYADLIVNKLKNGDRNNSVLFDAPFGMGKSSVLKWVSTDLISDGRCVVCHIDSWGRANESLVEQILRKLLNELRGYTDILQHTQLPKEYGSVMGGKGKALWELLSLHAKQSNPLHKLKKLNEELKYRGIKVVLIIEDLDRHPDNTLLEQSLAPFIDRIDDLSEISTIIALDAQFIADDNLIYRVAQHKVSMHTFEISDDFTRIINHFVNDTLFDEKCRLDLRISDLRSLKQNMHRINNIRALKFIWRDVFRIWDIIKHRVDFIFLFYYCLIREMHPHYLDKLVSGSVIDSNKASSENEKEVARILKTAARLEQIDNVQVKRRRLRQIEAEQPDADALTDLEYYSKFNELIAVNNMDQAKKLCADINSDPFFYALIGLFLTRSKKITISEDTLKILICSEIDAVPQKDELISSQLVIRDLYRKSLSDDQDHAPWLLSFSAETIKDPCFSLHSYAVMTSLNGEIFNFHLFESLLPLVIDNFTLLGEKKQFHRLFTKKNIQTLAFTTSLDQEGIELANRSFWQFLTKIHKQAGEIIDEEHKTSVNKMINCYIDGIISTDKTNSLNKFVHKYIGMELYKELQVDNSDFTELVDVNIERWLMNF